MQLHSGRPVVLLSVIDADVLPELAFREILRAPLHEVAT